MKLWLISQDSNNGYDTFSDAVVCAETEDIAKTIHPGGDGYDRLKPPSKDEESYIHEMSSWVRYPHLVEAKLIGEAVDDLKEAVICASFHAG